MLEPLDRYSSKPLYLQLDEILRSSIAEGIWKPDEMIPSESELSQKYNISRMTVRSVISQLTHEGMLYRVQGKGTFITQPKIDAVTPAYQGIREQLEQQGYDTIMNLLKIEKTVCNGYVAEKLRIKTGDPVMVIQILRYVQSIPFSLHTSYVPEHFMPDLIEKVTNVDQYQDYLTEKYKELNTKCFKETLEAITTTRDVADLIKVKYGYPLLKLEGICVTGNLEYFEYSEVLFRGDKIKLSFKY